MSDELKISMTQEDINKALKWSRDTIVRQAEDIERLRALVETGYEEGWEDATCQPMGLEVNWNHSKTRAALQPKESNQ